MTRHVARDGRDDPNREDEDDAPLVPTPRGRGTPVQHAAARATTAKDERRARVNDVAERDLDADEHSDDQDDAEDAYDHLLDDMVDGDSDKVFVDDDGRR